MSPAGKPPTPSDILNEDWLKTRSWDIWLGDRLVKTLLDLNRYCARQGMTLDHFLHLPAADAMPEELRDEARMWVQEQIAGHDTHSDGLDHNP